MKGRAKYPSSRSRSSEIVGVGNTRRTPTHAQPNQRAPYSPTMSTSHPAADGPIRRPSGGRRLDGSERKAHARYEPDEIGSDDTRVSANSFVGAADSARGMGGGEHLDSGALLDAIKHIVTEAVESSSSEQRVMITSLEERAIALEKVVVKQVSFYFILCTSRILINK